MLKGREKKILISKWFFNNMSSRIISRVRCPHLQILQYCFNEAHPRCLNCCAVSIPGLRWTSLALPVIIKALYKCFYQLGQILLESEIKELHRFCGKK